MRIYLPLSLLSLLTLSCQGALVAYWNFNGLSIASASAPGSGNAPSSISASLGNGSLNLSAWAGTVDDFEGTTMNTANSDPAEESLSLIAGSGTAGNGSSITLEVSLSDMSSPTLSFATQGTATGFNSNQLAWSLNGTDFTDIDTTYDPADSFGLHQVDLSSVNALDGAANAYFRLTFNGATGSSGNNRIDNVQLTAIPEPTGPILSLLGLCSLLLRRQR